LIQWRDTFWKGKVSPRFAYAFHEEIWGLQTLPGNAIKSEMHRLLKRHISSQLSMDEKTQLISKLLDNGILRLFECRVSLGDLAKFLDIAVFLGKEENR